MAARDRCVSKNCIWCQKSKYLDMVEGMNLIAAFDHRRKIKSGEIPRDTPLEAPPMPPPPKYKPRPGEIYNQTFTMQDIIDAGGIQNLKFGPPDDYLGPGVPQGFGSYGAPSGSGGSGGSSGVGGHTGNEGQAEGEKTQTLYIPVQKVEKCDGPNCGKKKNLRVCKACASAVYCSNECQKADWPKHKRLCIRTETINLKTFHPFIAYLFYFIRSKIRDFPTPPIHPGQSRVILQAPIIGPRKATLPDQTIRRRVTLGKPHPISPDEVNLGQWAPFAKTAKEALKMFYQVGHEEQIFESTAAVALCLLSEIYATDTIEAGKKASHGGPCFRLEYGTSVISDFGICKGKIRGRRLRVQLWTYDDYRTNESTTILDPDNHYWLYFKTAKGEEVSIDCNASGYGMPASVNSSHCTEDLPHSMVLPDSDTLPCYFRTPNTHSRPEDYALIEESRHTVMHDPDLQALLTSGSSPNNAMTNDTEKIDLFLAKVYGKEVSQDQDDKIWWYRAKVRTVLNHLLTGEHWAAWGKTKKLS